MAIKTISIWGSYGSGKTLTTVKIAKYLAGNKKNVIIVGCDDQTPLLPLLLPFGTDLPSLGHLLSLEKLSQINLMEHFVPFGKNQYISLLGYGREENVMSYPEYTYKRAEELFSHLERLSTVSSLVVLIDCTSNLDNYLTAVALKCADVTLRIVNADPKSEIYFQSAAPLLERESGYRYNEQISILNNLLPSQDPGPAQEVFGDIRFTLPNVSGLKEQYDAAQLLDSLPGRDSRQYSVELEKLMKEVFTDEQEEHGIIRRHRSAAVGDISGTA
ncbi:MAG TPA: hypothetical protein VHP31_08655 [Caproicibacter sp.]|nr:hypothetical protein [Caproicibacter sp.]